MRPKVLRPIFAGLLSLQACTWFVGVEPTDIGSINVGTDRQQVEKLLGKPIIEQETDLGPATVHRYQGTGTAGCVPEAEWCSYAIYMPYLWPLFEHEARKEIKKGERFLTVVYGADGKISHAFKNSGQPNQMLAFIQDASKADAAAEAKLHVGAILPPSKIYWQCRAATHGARSYLYDMGRRYELGYGEFPPDKVKAFAWYSQISDPSGNVKSKLEELRSGMTETQLQDAERLVATWQPNVSDCDRFLGANSG